MTSAAITVLNVSVLWSTQLLALLFNQMVIGYIKSKPPGLKSLLDYSYQLLFVSLQVILPLRLTIGTLHNLGIDFGDPQSTVLAWILQSCINLIIISWIAAIVTNILFVRFPSTMVNINDNTFIAMLIISTCMMTATATLTEWSMGLCSFTYPILRMLEEQCSPLNVVRASLLSIAFVSTIGFKLYLMITNNTFEEGERNILSSKVLVLITIPFLVLTVIFGIFSQHFPDISIGASMFCFPAFPLIVIICNDNLRSYGYNKVLRLFQWDRFILHSSTQTLSRLQAQSVAPYDIS